MSSSAAYTSSRSTFDLEGKRRRLEEVGRQLSAPDLWDDPQAAQKLGQEASGLRARIEEIDSLDRDSRAAQEMLGLLDVEPDAELLAEVVSDIERVSCLLD